MILTKQKTPILTEQAPQVLGPYSQAIRMQETVYLSGQIPIDPRTQVLVSDEISAQTAQVFSNIQAVCQAAEGELADIVKLTIYLTDLTHFPIVNDMMSQLFTPPYPARTTIQVAALPKAAKIEIEAIMVKQCQ